MSKTINKNIVCPRCFSNELYRFGKDKNGYQKYQCKICKRQFIPDAKPRKLKGYPRCPKCGKGTFIHHNYKYYVQFRCNDKKCNHSFYQVKPKFINSTSSKSILGKTDFSKIRFPVYLIILVLRLYYLDGSSTRKISKHLMDSWNIKISHVTIASWVKKFAPMFKFISNKLLKTISFKNSNKWHVDETVVFINGKKYYLWVVIDSDTRMIVAYHLSPYRNSSEAFKVLNEAKNLGNPKAIVTDRLPSYNIPVKVLFSSSEHIKVKSFKDDISNNLIESFFKTFKDWYKSKKGFNSFNSANNLIFMFIFHYNFVRIHSSLDNK
ncbi:integrase, partial [Caloranaerobacter azorensis H53214]